MDTEEKREMYAVTRRAVRDEIRAMISDFVTSAIGSALVVAGLLGTAGWVVRGGLFTLQAGVSVFLALLGFGMLAVTWGWDRWFRQRLPIGNTARR